MLPFLQAHIHEQMTRSALTSNRIIPLEYNARDTPCRCCTRRSRLPLSSSERSAGSMHRSCTSPQSDSRLPSKSSTFSRLKAAAKSCCSELSLLQVLLCKLSLLGADRGSP